MAALLAVLTLLSLPAIPRPTATPIPCVVCAAAKAADLTFSGVVQHAKSDRLDVFNAKTHQSMSFGVPADFHGVESSDGVIHAGPVTRAVPGLLTRVTYRSVPGRAVVTGVLLLTINQCRALMAAERLSHTDVECPD